MDCTAGSPGCSAVPSDCHLASTSGRVFQHHLIFACDDEDAGLVLMEDLGDDLFSRVCTLPLMNRMLVDETTLYDCGC